MKVDLHVHSRFSEHPSEWFLQRLGANESYTDPELIQTLAKSRGMNLVCLTDHNCLEGSLLLKEKYPSEVLTGVEATAYFPEDGNKVHVLIYGLTESEFQEVQHFRKDVYELRGYLKAQNLAHSLAHATYIVNNRLTPVHLEKLILLFDVFEGINGGRNRMNNQGWTRILSHLTPEHLEDLYHIHRIEPYSDDPWVKGLTGGSDDHAGIYVGKTWTNAAAEDIPGLLAAIRSKRTTAQGRHNDYQSLALSVYKVAFDFSKTRSESLSSSLLSQLTDLVFYKKSLGWVQKIQINKLKLSNKRNGNGVHSQLIELIDYLKEEQPIPVEDKLEVIYGKIASLADEFIKTTCNAVEKDLEKVDLIGLLTNVSALLPGIFLSVPFFSTLKHLHQSRTLIRQLNDRLEISPARQGERILWFTDTLNDLNGVAVTLQEIGRLAHKRGLNLKIAATVAEGEIPEDLVSSLLPLPFVHQFKLPYYENYTMRLPSPLKSLQALHEFDPDRIIISTPGPVGLFGALAARMLNVPSIGIYHTDYKLQAGDIAEDEELADLLESYIRWFYDLLDELQVPPEYMDTLEARGHNRAKMQPYHHGIDTELFKPLDSGREFLQRHYRLQDGFTLLYTGRLSKDKGLDFLADLYLRLKQRYSDLNLILVGDGPHRPALEAKLKSCGRVIFTGRLEREKLVPLYSGADLFLFPSTSDTFGISVAEAQSCGLPAVVSNVGGPRKVIIPEKSGLVAWAGDLDNWMMQVSCLIEMLQHHPVARAQMKLAARDNAQRFSWEHVFDHLLGLESVKQTPTSPKTLENLSHVLLRA